MRRVGCKRRHAVVKNVSWRLKEESRSCGAMNRSNFLTLKGVLERLLLAAGQGHPDIILQ